jgi:hypothetical protein
LASSTAARFKLPLNCSSLASNFSNSVKASAVAPATGDDFIAMEFAHLARAALHHRLSEAHLPIAHHDDFAAV